MMLPCSVKKEIKQWLQIETSQQVKVSSVKVGCSSNFQLENTKEIADVKKKSFTFSKFIGGQQYSFVENNSQLPDLYTPQKEKIPSYLFLNHFII